MFIVNFKKYSTNQEIFSKEMINKNVLISNLFKKMLIKEWNLTSNTYIQDYFKDSNEIYSDSEYSDSEYSDLS